MRPLDALLLGAAAAAAEPPVLAYLFTLRKARHPMPHAWNTYLSGCAPGSFRVHIHVDPTFNATDLEEHGPAAKYFRQKHVLPRADLLKVRRFGHELVRARMKLLRHALGAGAAGGAPPLWASFFSESCAPIASCTAVHEYLRGAARAEPRASFIEEKRRKSKEQLKDSPLWRSEFAKICPRCEAAGIPASAFRFSPGWVTLWHEHAATLLANEARFDEVFATWGWSKLVNGIPARAAPAHCSARRAHTYCDTPRAHTLQHHAAPIHAAARRAVRSPTAPQPTAPPARLQRIPRRSARAQCLHLHRPTLPPRLPPPRTRPMPPQLSHPSP
jgi:hypothetical protein